MLLGGVFVPFPVLPVIFPRWLAVATGVPDQMLLVVSSLGVQNSHRSGRSDKQ